MKSNNIRHSIQSNEPDVAKPRVLLIDDSRLVRISINRVIAAEFDITEAVDGEDGWEKLLNDDNIQVVITDAGMPKLDGYGLIERIRGYAQSHIKDIPIIMVTGAEADATEIREKALKIGATDFITKPFDKAQLLARVRAHAKFDETKRNLEYTSDALAEQSAVDPLTKTRNRRYCLQRGDQDLAFAARHQQNLAIIAIGIDDFPNIKSKYGKQTSDGVLVWVAELITDIMRKEDTIARIDDGSFGIIAPTAPRMAAATLCQRMRKRISHTPYSETVIALPITVSIGLVSHGHDERQQFSAYLELAEKRLQFAQANGGNRIIASERVAPPAQTIAANEAPDINTALNMVVKRNYDALLPFLLALVRRVFPLLELANRKLGWGLDIQLDAIRQKLADQ